MREKSVEQAEPRRGLGSLASRLFRPRPGIGLRLLAVVVLFSSAVTLVLTSIEFYLDYRRGVDAIDARLDEIGAGYSGALAEGLWNVDARQIQAELDGILRLPTVTHAAVVESGATTTPVRIEAGEHDPGDVKTREFPITYQVGGTQRQIGTLTVEASLSEVRHELIQRLLVVGVAQGAKTFIVSAFILFIVHQLITRHLQGIAAFLRGFRVDQPLQTLRLQREAPPAPDELDEVAQAINAASADLGKAYEDLRKANAQLKADIGARRAAEDALLLSEQRMRDYAETAFDWFWETDLDHRFSVVPDALSDWGVNPATRIGQGRWDFAADIEEEPEKWRDHFAILAAHQPFRDFRYRTARADGTDVWVTTSGKPVFDAEGNFLGYRGVSSDITPTVRAEAALRRAQAAQLALQAQKIEAEEERLRLLQRMIAAQEQERLRITRDLHDQTGQDLTGLSLGLKSLEPVLADARGHATLRWLQALTAQIGSNLHRTAWELRPTALNDLGLLRALETYTGDWSERFGIRVDYHAGDLTRRFADDIETTVYRVVQESLTNVLRHAAASTVSLVLELRDGTLRVIIEDDGRGFDVEAVAARGRLGLPGIAERLALVGGSLSIDSSPGAGTTLYIRIPIAQSG
ncbi:ATP-binding protein [Dongia sp.]|uniref:ATP-binding protein n=1 Tax=Dongia sp. TaxID=1977262 RepID=UPI0037500C86